MNQASFIVDENNNDRRIERFLRLKTGLPNVLFFKLFRKGKILLNGKAVREGCKVTTNDTVYILYNFVPVVHDAPIVNFDLLRDNLLFENKELLVIHKPRGLPSQGGLNIADNCHDIMKSYCHSISSSPYHIVHRLDRETSGIFIFAKNIPSANKLMKKFKERKIVKVYVTFLKGKLDKIARISAHLAKDREKMCVHASGKESASTFFPIIHAQNGTIALVVPQSGRTHQIRVHAALLDHSLVADKKYQEVNIYDRVGLVKYIADYQIKEEDSEYKVDFSSFFLHNMHMEIDNLNLWSFKSNFLDKNGVDLQFIYQMAQKVKELCNLEYSID